MKSRPILFSAPMVRAILAGEKTQTRRVVKPQPPLRCQYDINGAKSHAICQSTNHPGVFVPPTPKSVDHRLPCPYGQPGDQLWVKETYRVPKSYDSIAPRDLHLTSVRYEVDGSEKPLVPWWDSDEPGRIRQSIFMRKWMSRITLEITDIRAERLRGISDDDAKAEGVEHKNYVYPSEAFAELWKSINGPGSWENNPWVWVVEFRKIDTEGNTRRTQPTTD